MFPSLDAATPETLAIYLHWPFCARKCPYCDFNSHVRDSIDQEAWRKAYIRGLEGTFRQTGPREVTSVFFGGGTPSLMPPETVAAVIETVDRLWGLPQGAEVTLEANPGSSEAASFKAFCAAGVNRVSIGVQALNDADLRRLGRLHSAAEARAAVEMAQSIFTRVSFDLIYAREGQSLAAWQRELTEALNLAGGHVSLYQLTIEEGTPFHALFRQGALTLPADDESADMFEWTQAEMAAAGLPAYEVSNHARPGDESRHNLVYWQGGDYAGVGPGAHGRLTVSGRRLATRQHRAPDIWLSRMREDISRAEEQEEILPEAFARERVMMGLRLARGIDRRRFAALTGQSLESCLDLARLRVLLDEGYLEEDGDILRAAPSGRQRLNSLLTYVLKPAPG